MTKEDFDKRGIALATEYQKKLRELQTEYMIAYNVYKEGDIIEDHHQRIKIESIVFSFPQCLYKGAKLRKNLTPYLNGDKEIMYGSNIKRKLN